MTMHNRLFSAATLASAAVALIAGCLLSSSCRAESQALDDTQLSTVRGADGTIVLDLSSSTGNGLVDGLAAAFSGSTGSTLLTGTEFARALHAIGLTTAQMPDYAGQDVAQTRVDAAPGSFTFDLSSVLRAVGVSYNGASMGLLSMTNFDARGTTLWVWSHH